MNKVERYYGESYDEWSRLERHKIEFDITKRYLDRYLQGENLRIFDIGGGPGRYAFYLAKQGHRVTLLDLTKRHIEIAQGEAKRRGLQLEAYIHGNALELDHYESDYDAILLMGPLYHLTREADRRLAVAGAVRLLKPGGIMIAAFISNYAPICDTFKFLEAPGSPDTLLCYLKQGVSSGEHGFTVAYFTGHQEARQLMRDFHLEELAFVAVENILSLREHEINELPPAEYEKWLALCFELGQDPNLWGVGEHYLYIGRKP